MKFNRTDRLTTIKQTGFVGSSDLQGVSVEAGRSPRETRGFQVPHETSSVKSDLIFELQSPVSPTRSRGGTKQGPQRESQDFAAQRLDTAPRASVDEGPQRRELL